MFTSPRAWKGLRGKYYYDAKVWLHCRFLGLEIGRVVGGFANWRLGDLLTNGGLKDLRTSPGTRRFSSEFSRRGGCNKISCMNDKQARIHAVSEWLMEFSVLWAVFPLLDQLLGSGPIRLGLTTLCFAISFLAALSGILLRKGDPE